MLQAYERLKVAIAAGVITEDEFNAKLRDKAQGCEPRGDQFVDLVKELLP